LIVFYKNGLLCTIIGPSMASKALGPSGLRFQNVYDNSTMHYSSAS